MLEEWLNYSPDVVAMLVLIAPMLWQLRRHPTLKIDDWLLGFFFTLLSQLAWYITILKGTWHQIGHAIELGTMLLAGVAFMVYPSHERRRSSLYEVLAAGAGVLVTTAYGFDTVTRSTYWVCIGVTWCISLVASRYAAGSWPAARLRMGLYTGCAAVAAVLTWRHDWRGVAYWYVGVVYAAAAVNAWRRLRARTIGRRIVVIGLGVWSLAFLTHSWVIAHSFYFQFAEQVWTKQKYLVAVGVLTMLLEEQIEANQWLAQHDQLTMLPNRRGFEQLLTVAIATARQQGTRLAVMLLDLDSFKEVNDTLGHHVGDELLQAVAANLRTNLRGTDLVARLGGDEFVVLAQGLGPDDPLPALSSRVRAALTTQTVVNGHRLHIEGSVGAALYPDDVPQTDDAAAQKALLLVADERMYQEKRHRSSALAGD